MKIRFLSPIFLFPLGLVTPYIYKGSYGVTVLELLFLFSFFVFALPKILIGEFKIPRFLFLYFVLFFLGWLGALVNGGVNWDMAVGLANLNFFYYILLALSGYYIGYYRYNSVEAIVHHPFAKCIFTLLIALIFTYPFLSYAIKYAFFHYFFPPGQGEISRLYSVRFPGLGVNANVYAFMLSIPFLFYVNSFIYKQSSLYMPLLLFIAIVITGCKSVLILCIVSSFTLIFSVYSLKKVNNILNLSKILSVLIFLTAIGFYYFNFTESGNEQLDKLSGFTRLGHMLEKDPADGENSFEVRFEAWGMGMERVALAPIIGIVIDRFQDSNSRVLSFTTPHNEFIAQWMFYGLVGMLAHIILLVTLFCKNRNNKQALIWRLLYSNLIIFMLFDGAFSAVRFQPLFFMLVGMNLKFLYITSVDKIVKSSQGYGLSALSHSM